jgi:carboxyl-terminal processing protease
MFPTRTYSTVLSILLLGPSLAQGRPSEDDLSIPDRAFVAARIYSSLESYFAHGPGLPELDLDAAFKGYLARALTANGRREFDLTTLEFIARLRNKHTQFNDPWLNQRYGQPLGFGALPVEGQWVITWSRDDRLKKGDLIRAIDGVDVGVFASDRQRYISASSERGRQSLVFDRATLFPRRFTLELEDGRKVAIDRDEPAKVPARDAEAPASEGRWISEGSLFYMKIPSFNDDRFESTAVALVKEHEDARCLILDVRGNGGGRTPYELLRQLMDREWRSWTTTTPMLIALHRAQGTGPTQLRLESQRFQPRPGAFKGRVILLVDRFTCSACEDFVMPFQQNGRARIIGEATEGSSGQPYFLDLGKGMSLMVGAARHTFPDGSPFESVGIEPTTPVELRINDLRRGIDPVLEKAKEVAALP